MEPKQKKLLLILSGIVAIAAVAGVAILGGNGSLFKGMGVMGIDIPDPNIKVDFDGRSTDTDPKNEFSLSTYTAAEPTDVNFKFHLTKPIPPQGRITLYAPVGFKIDAVSNAGCTVKLNDEAPLERLFETNTNKEIQTITISRGYNRGDFRDDYEIKAGSDISCKFTGLFNPTDVIGLVSPFIIETYSYKGLNFLDKTTTQNVTIKTPYTKAENYIAPTSDGTGSQYTVHFIKTDQYGNASYTFASKGYFTVEFPKEFNISQAKLDTTKASGGCNLNGKLTITKLGQVIEIRRGGALFDGNPADDGTEITGSLIECFIDNVTLAKPGYIGPTDGFIIKTFDGAIQNTPINIQGMYFGAPLEPPACSGITVSPTELSRKEPTSLSVIVNTKNDDYKHTAKITWSPMGGKMSEGNEQQFTTGSDGQKNRFVPAVNGEGMTKVVVTEIADGVAIGDCATPVSIKMAPQTTEEIAAIQAKIDAAQKLIDDAKAEEDAKKAADEKAAAEQKAADELAMKTKAEAEKAAADKAVADKAAADAAEADKIAAQAVVDKAAADKAEKERLAAEAEKAAAEKKVAAEKAAKEAADAKAATEKAAKEVNDLRDQLAAAKAAEAKFNDAANATRDQMAKQKAATEKMATDANASKDAAAKAAADGAKSVADAATAKATADAAAKTAPNSPNPNTPKTVTPPPIQFVTPQTITLSSSSDDCAGFKDIKVDKVGEAFCKDAAYAKSIGAITGDANNMLLPNAPLQRDQAAKIVLEAFNRFNANLNYCNNRPPFVDIKNTDWAWEYICAAKKSGTITGYQEGVNKGLYRPDTFVTRIEFLTLLSRSVKEAMPGSNSVSYADVAVGDWTSGPAKWAQNNQFFTGRNLYPNQSITRGEVVGILAKLGALGQIPQ